MASESELCVDELIARARKADELAEKLTLDKSDNINEESRNLLHATQLYIDNNVSLVPSYILKKVTDSLKRLEKQVDSCNKTKMTFKFSSKPNCSMIKSKNIEQQDKNCIIVLDKKDEPQQAFCGYSNRNNEVLRLSPDVINSKDVSLVDLTGCEVRIIGLANTLYIRNLKQSTVLVCLACRAITVTNCENCTFKFVCQQLRIDSTTDSSFTLFISARSMLESSRNLTFKMLNLAEFAEETQISDILQPMLRRANFSENQNNWRCIDDFDWLSDSPSPNYKICE